MPVGSARKRFRRVLLVVLMVAGGGMVFLGLQGGPAFWNWLRTEVVNYGSQDGSGWARRIRWGSDAGKRHGMAMVWKQGRILRIERYHLDTRHGIWTDFRADGSIQYQNRYENGFWREQRTRAPWWGSDGKYDRAYREVENGSWVLEYPDGRTVEQFFRHGKRHGAWTFRDPEGNVIRQRLYRDGEHVRYRVGPPWLATGQLPEDEPPR